MYNVAKIFIICVLAGLFVACSGDNSRAEKADEILAQAQAQLASGDFQNAFTLLDTLDKTYRDCLTQRREGTIIRTKALIALTEDSIKANDARRVALSQVIDAAAPKFRTISVPGTAGYRVENSIYTGRETDVTGIQPRIDENDYMYLAVSVKGRVLNITALQVGDSITRGVVSVPVEGSEIATVRQEQAAPVVAALLAAQAPVSVTVKGLKGKVDVRLDARQLAALKATIDYATAMQQHRLALIQREKLERQIVKLRENLIKLETARPEDEK